MYSVHLFYFFIHYIFNTIFIPNLILLIFPRFQGDLIFKLYHSAQLWKFNFHIGRKKSKAQVITSMVEYFI